MGLLLFVTVPLNVISLLLCITFVLVGNAVLFFALRSLVGTTKGK